VNYTNISVQRWKSISVCNYHLFNLPFTTLYMCFSSTSMMAYVRHVDPGVMPNVYLVCGVNVE